MDVALTAGTTGINKHILIPNPICLQSTCNLFKNGVKFFSIVS